MPEVWGCEKGHRWKLPSQQGGPPTPPPNCPVCGAMVLLLDVDTIDPTATFPPAPVPDGTAVVPAPEPADLDTTALDDLSTGRATNLHTIAEHANFAFVQGSVLVIRQASAELRMGQLAAAE